MGKQKNSKKEFREGRELSELTRCGRTKAEEERELYKLKQEGILHMDKIRIGVSGFSYQILGLSSLSKKSRIPLPDRQRSLYNMTPKRTLDYDRSSYMPSDTRFHQMRRNSTRKIEDKQELRRFKRVEPRTKEKSKKRNALEKAETEKLKNLRYKDLFVRSCLSDDEDDNF